MTSRINCLKCQYFYITWDKNFPRGCKAFGFKTKNLPSLVVFQSSGQSCQHFKPKEEATR
ncbi:MAG: uracil-DNA glycosylase [Clostridia bacterium]|nr:uracil-DNA glycosylase [Clostridia bacterium]